MERNNFWTFLALGLAIGFCLEVMKSPAGKSKIRLAGFTRFQTILDEGREVAVAQDEDTLFSPKSNRKKSEEIVRPRQLLAEELNPANNSATEVTTGQAAASPTPKSETEEEKKNRLAAEKKKRIEDKKKAYTQFMQQEDEKRKFWEAQQAQALAAAMAENNNEAHAADPATPEQPNAGYQNGRPTDKTGDENKGTDRRSAAEWEAYLTQTANVSRMNEFIGALHSGEVTTDVYYSVLHSMLSDHRAEIQQLALTGLTAVPSVASFNALVAITNPTTTNSSAGSSSGTDAGGAIKSQAQAALSVYALPANVGILGHVMASGSNPDAVLKAIQTFQQSVDQNLRASASSTTGGPTHSSAVASIYQPFASELAKISQSGQTPAIKAAAQAALSDLQANLTTNLSAEQTTPVQNQIEQ
jgi:hypothetical protein